MREDEILTLGNAVVEAYIMNGSKLYATIYTEPGRQKKSEVTYVTSDEVIKLIDKDSNIVEKARNEIIGRYNSNYNDNGNMYRSSINDLVGKNDENKEELVETGVQQEITKLQTSRQQYVESLQGGTTEVE